jgi:hypothetical protein
LDLLDVATDDREIVLDSVFRETEFHRLQRNLRKRRRDKFNLFDTPQAFMSRDDEIIRFHTSHKRLVLIEAKDAFDHLTLWLKKRREESGEKRRQNGERRANFVENKKSGGEATVALERQRRRLLRLMKNQNVVLEVLCLLFILRRLMRH